MMNIDVITASELEAFRRKLIGDMKELIEKAITPREEIAWIRAEELKNLMQISGSTLQKWRNEGTVRFAIFGGICYYDKLHILRAMEARQR